MRSSIASPAAVSAGARRGPGGSASAFMMARSSLSAGSVEAAGTRSGKRFWRAESGAGTAGGAVAAPCGGVMTGYPSRIANAASIPGIGTEWRRVESRNRRTRLHAISGVAAGPQAATCARGSARQSEQTSVVPPAAKGSDAASQVRGASGAAAWKHQLQYSRVRGKPPATGGGAGAGAGAGAGSGAGAATRPPGGVCMSKHSSQN